MKTLARALWDTLQSLRVTRVNKLDFHQTHRRLVATLQRAHGTDQGARLAVGGEFDAVGFLELETLRHFGLKEDSYVIDIGCGAGRLAGALSQWSKGKYLGVDVVPALVAYARRVAARPDWRFEIAKGLSIPEEDATADFVCFFSVFTHLLHEQSYIYLQEAKRVLKPAGRVVFSFLDFTVRDHWKAFEGSLSDAAGGTQPLNVFMSKDAIRIWAEHLGLEVCDIEDGDRAFVRLSRPVRFESGAVAHEVATIGQSVCVFQK